MPKKERSTAEATQKTHEEPPRCTPIAEQGINSSRDFMRFCSALISDVVSGRMKPAQANAASSVGGKLLKMAELELRYGMAQPGPFRRPLPLFSEAELPATLPAAGSSSGIA